LAEPELNTTTRLRMEDLQRMKQRLEDVEYNQVVQLLEYSATTPHDPLALRGVFVDGFTDLDRIDPDLTNVAFSFDDGTITLQTHTRGDKTIYPRIRENTRGGSWGRIISAPFTEFVEAQQPFATKAWNLNPYGL